MTADMEQLRWLLEQVDRHLTGRPDLEVHWITEESPVWGFANGTHIYLGADVVQDWLTQRPTAHGLSCLLGLNFHELGHVLFSPDTDEVHRGWDWEQATTWNLLEDHRIERRMNESYPLAQQPLTDLGIELVQDVPDLVDAAVLLAGRSFLPDLVRRSSLGAFASTHGLPAHDRLCTVVEEYVQLADASTARMAELVDDLHDLLWSIGWFGDIELQSPEVADEPFDTISLDDFDFEAHLQDDVEWLTDLVDDANERWDEVAEAWFRTDIHEHKRRAA